MEEKRRREEEERLKDEKEEKRLTGKKAHVCQENLEGREKEPKKLMVQQAVIKEAEEWSKEKKSHREEGERLRDEKEEKRPADKKAHFCWENLEEQEKIQKIKTVRVYRRVYRNKTLSFSTTSQQQAEIKGAEEWNKEEKRHTEEDKRDKKEEKRLTDKRTHICWENLEEQEKIQKIKTVRK